MKWISIKDVIPMPHKEEFDKHLLVYTHNCDFEGNPSPHQSQLRQRIIKIDYIKRFSVGMALALIGSKEHGEYWISHWMHLIEGPN